MKKCTKRWLLPVCAAAMTLAAGFSSLAAETVKVTVPNVKGGEFYGFITMMGRQTRIFRSEKQARSQRELFWM